MALLSALMSLTLLTPPLSGLLASQDSPQQDRPVPPVLKAPPILASDGEPAVPGRIPSDVTPKALERWKELLQSTRVQGSAPRPIQSFSMGFDIRVRKQGEAGYPTKEERATFDYQDEGGGYVRGTFAQSGRVMLRGPKGDLSLIHISEPTRPY